MSRITLIFTFQTVENFLFESFQRVDELGKENNRLKAEIHRLVQRNPAEEDQKIQSESAPLSSTDLPAEEKTVLEKIFVEKIIVRLSISSLIQLHIKNTKL